MAVHSQDTQAGYVVLFRCYTQVMWDHKNKTLLDGYTNIW